MPVDPPGAAEGEPLEGLAGGLPDDPPGLPAVVRLEVLPGSQLALAPARWQQLAVVAHFADGSAMLLYDAGSQSLIARLPQPLQRKLIGLLAEK